MGVDQIRGDIGDRHTVETACRGVELVFHVAAKPPPWGKYRDYYKTNVTGTQNLIDGCALNNISRLVYTSTPSVIFDGTDMQGVNESVPYPARFNAFYPDQIVDNPHPPPVLITDFKLANKPVYIGADSGFQK